MAERHSSALPSFPAEFPALVLKELLFAVIGPGGAGSDLGLKGIALSRGRREGVMGGL